MHDEFPDLAGQPAREVDAVLRRALEGLSRAHRSAVVCFAEILARRLYRELGYSSIHHYAATALGFSPGRTAQFLRLAMALNRLPLLREAVRTGALSWTKALVVAVIATERTEAVWLAEAQRLGRVELVRRAAVARARAREAVAAEVLALSCRPLVLPPCPLTPAPPPPEVAPPVRPLGPASQPAPPPCSATAPSSPTSPAPQRELTRLIAAPAQAQEALPSDVPLHVTLRFSPAQYARFAVQIERLRKLRVPGARLLPATSSREDLLLAALDELIAAAASAATAAMVAAAGAPPSTEVATVDGTGPRGCPPLAPASAASRYQIVLYRCEVCGRTRVTTPLGDRALPPAAAAAAACDAQVVTADGRLAATIPPRVRRIVFARDGHRCQMPGCGRTRFLEVHHRLPRARGGGHDPDNLITLCSACHRLRHAGASESAAAARAG